MAVDYPQRIDIIPWGNWSANSGWGVRGAAGGLGLGALQSNAGAAAGAWVEWRPLLKSGTYSATFIYYRGGGANFGQVTPKLDGVSLGTVLEQYAATGANDVVTTITGIVVSTSALHTLRLEVTGKNASSSGFWAAMQHITLTRTGA